MSQLSPEEIAAYDKHNPGARTHPDPTIRLYGKCGCLRCGQTRKHWATFLAPIDDPRRETTNMGSINICDRCPSMVKGVALGRVQLVTGADHTKSEVITKELCPACVEDVVLLLDIHPDDRPQRAYDKPYSREPERDAVSDATSEQLAAALLEKLMKETRRQIESSTDHVG